MAIHKRLKKVIHPNRYLFWAVAAVVILGAALAAYIYITNYSFERQFVFEQVSAKRTYSDASNGFSFRYPAKWVLEKDNSGNVIFENPSDASESITLSVRAISDEQQIRSTFKVISEEDSARPNGVRMAIISARPTGGGAAFKAALVKVNGKLFYFYGQSSLFEQIINTFQVI